MSRRSILLIASTVLVLLAIPVIYLACTWSTDNPLRFEVTGLHDGSNSGIIYPNMDLTVRNTSRLPVYIDRGPWMEMPDITGRAQGVHGHMVVKVPGGPGLQLFAGVYLQPGDSKECTFIFSSENDVRDPRKYLESVEVHYVWHSDTVEKVRELRERLEIRGPRNLHKIIPFPKSSRHSARLDLPATLSP